MIDMLAASDLPRELGVGGAVLVLWVVREIVPIVRGRNGTNGSQRHNAIIKAILDSNKEIVKELYKLRCVFEKRPCIARDLKRDGLSTQGPRPDHG